MSEGRVGIAFIGAGRVSENHFRALQRCKDGRLLGVFDIDKRRAEQCAQNWNTTTYETVDEVYLDQNVDAVFVLTPVEYHYEYTLKTLEAGKHVLVEKPVSFNPLEIRRMAQTAEKTGKACVPGHNYIYLPQFARTKRLIEKDLLGQICHMEMKEIYLMPETYIGHYHGVLGEVFCHPIYTMLYLLGSPSKVCGFATCFRSEQIPTGDEQVLVMAGFDSGPTASLMISWAFEDETSDPWTFKVKVLGTNGGSSFSRRDAVCGVSDGKPPWEYPMYDESFEREVDFFVTQCVKKGKIPPSTLEDAFQTVRILDAIKKSISNGTVEVLD